MSILGICGISLALIALVPAIAWYLSWQTNRVAVQSATVQIAGGANGDGHSDTGPAQATTRVRPARQRWVLPTMTLPEINFGALAVWIPGAVLAFVGWSIGDWLDAWAITPIMWARPITWLLATIGLFAPWAIRWTMRAQQNYQRRTRPTQRQAPVILSTSDGGVTIVNAEPTTGSEENLIQYLGAGSVLNGIFGLGVLVALSVAYWALAATINDYVEITTTAWVLIGAVWLAGGI